MQIKCNMKIPVGRKIFNSDSRNSWIQEVKLERLTTKIQIGIQNKMICTTQISNYISLAFAWLPIQMSDSFFQRSRTQSAEPRKSTDDSDPKFCNAIMILFFNPLRLFLSVYNPFSTENFTDHSSITDQQFCLLMKLYEVSLSCVIPDAHYYTVLHLKCLTDVTPTVTNTVRWRLKSSWTDWISKKIELNPCFVFNV